MSDPRAEALREAAKNVVSEYRKTHLMHDVGYENVADSIDALVAALALPEPALDVERLARALIQTGIYIDDDLPSPSVLAGYLVAEYAKLSQREDG